MNFLKSLFFLIAFSTFICFQAEAQSKLRPTHVGIYHSGMVGQVAIGTDLNQKYFGDLRFQATDILETNFGIEGAVHRNLFQDDWFNLHVGFMAGYYFYDSIRLGIPVGFSIMPFENHRRFAILLEASPNVFLEGEFINIRANVGIRYTFRN